MIQTLKSKIPMGMEKLNPDSITTESTEISVPVFPSVRVFHAFSGLSFRLNYGRLRNYIQLKN